MQVLHSTLHSVDTHKLTTRLFEPPLHTLKENNQTKTRYSLKSINCQHCFHKIGMKRKESRNTSHPHPHSSIQLPWTTTTTPRTQQQTTTTTNNQNLTSGTPEERPPEKSQKPVLQEGWSLVRDDRETGRYEV